MLNYGLNYVNKVFVFVISFCFRFVRHLFLQLFRIIYVVTFTIQQPIFILYFSLAVFLMVSHTLTYLSIFFLIFILFFLSFLLFLLKSFLINVYPSFFNSVITIKILCFLNPFLKW